MKPRESMRISVVFLAGLFCCCPFIRGIASGEPAVVEEKAGAAGPVEPGKITPEIKGLLDCLGHTSFKVREEATTALIAMGRKVGPHVTPLLKSDDPEIRLRAKRIVVQVGTGPIEHVDAEIYAKVTALLDPVASSSHANLNVIVGMGQKVVPSLVKACKDGHESRTYAMIVLTRIADPRSFRYLAETVQENKLGTHSSIYIRMMKDKRMIPHLLVVWKANGEAANGNYYSTVKALSRRDLGNNPDAWLKEYKIR